MLEKFAWGLPLFAALVWIGTLLGLLINWLTIGRPHYPSMESNQTIAYISDTGAYVYQPLFIAGSAVTVVFLDLGMICERWFRHKGKLAPNTGKFQKAMDILAIFAAICGAAGLILLSIFNTDDYPTAHDDLLILFIVGYVVSAIAICTEYQRLGIKYRQHRVLRASFWMKLAFILIEIALAIPFGIFMFQDEHANAGAVLEWVIAFVFALYIITFVVDLVPAFSSKHHYSMENNAEMAYAKSRYPGEAYGGGDAYAESSPGTSGVNGQPPAAPSSNF